MKRFFMSRKAGKDDLEEYRRGYPNKSDNNNPRDNRNLLFYRNEMPMMPDQILIDQFHTNCFGRYPALEQGHSYIQWLFPIQEESPFNPQSQQLQKHEIVAMKRDPTILKRIFKSLELMLDFYGFDIIAESPNVNNNNKNNNNNKEKQKVDNNNKDDDDSENSGSDDEDDAPQNNERQQQQDPYDKFDWINLKFSRCVVQRQPDDKRWKQKFNNLLTHGHNNLRITRILKCLGEMELENLKLAVLLGFKKEIFETGVLGDLSDSFLSYWSGTIYSDAIREQFQTVPETSAKKRR